MKLARDLEMAATLCGAFLAGGGLDRVAVAMPAWRIVGANGWAAFSRHADLGNGLVLYPTAAIGGFALSLAAALAYFRDRTGSRKAGLPILLSVLFSAGGLALTAQAAPFMLSLRRIGDDPVALQRAFDGFDWWGGIRAVVQIAMFIANLWALVAIAESAPSRDEYRARS